MRQPVFKPLENYLKKNCRSEMDLTDPAFQLQSYRKHDVIFSEGAKGYAAYIVKKGRVEISVKAKGKKVVITTLGEKSVFGEMALILAEHARTATAAALEDSEIVKVPKNVFDAYMAESPWFISTCLIAIAGRLQESTGKASTIPDAFMGVAHILDLLSEHGQRELSYEKTIAALWKSLSKRKAEIVQTISIMEGFNLLQVKEDPQRKKSILLQKDGGFAEKAMNVHCTLESLDAGPVD